MCRQHINSNKKKGVSSILCNCELTDRNARKFFGSGNSNFPTIMVIGESPSKIDVDKGVAFSCNVGRLTRYVLKFLEIPENYCYFTYLVGCELPGDIEKPTAAIAHSCMSRLKQQVEEIRPEYILTLGASVASYVFPKVPGGLNELRGKVLPTVFGVPGVATIHPASVLAFKGASKFSAIVQDVQKLWNTARDISAQYANIPTEVFVCDTEEKWGMLKQWLQSSDTISYDWETTGLSPRTASGFCLALSWEVGRSAVIPLKTLLRIRPQLNDILSKTTLIAFNGMFDLKWNRKYGLPNKLDHDPMLMHYMLDERPQRRSLEVLSGFFCDAPPYESEMLAKYKCDKTNFLQVIPPEEIYQYAGMDTDYTLRLYKIFLPEVTKNHKLYRVYSRLVMPAAVALSEIEENGFFVDVDALASLKESLEAEVCSLQEQLAALTGNPKFNPNSHKQVQDYVWDILKLEEPQLVDRSPRSLDKETREALLKSYPDHPFISLLHKYKWKHTLLSRYVNALPDYIEDDHRVRPSYHLDRTETGRLSATSPPIHQIPREADIRQIFCAPTGSSLIQADYAQIEMRMAAHIAQDPQFTRLFEEGVDFHTKMAAEAYRISLEEVTKEQRQAAKGVSFGLLYLMGDRKLAENTGLTPDEAVEFVKNYKALMPGVMQWIRRTKQSVYTKRYVESVFGRRRRFPFITPENLHELQREGVNMPIQSSASDLTLWQVVKLHNMFKDRYQGRVKIITMVHDSIIVECPDELVQEVGLLMKTEMEKPPFTTKVPFKADVKFGKRWGEEGGEFK